MRGDSVRSWYMSSGPDTWKSRPEVIGTEGTAKACWISLRVTEGGIDTIGWEWQVVCECFVVPNQGWIPIAPRGRMCTVYRNWCSVKSMSSRC